MNKELFLLLLVIVLSFASEKCRQYVGEEASSRSWTERFTFLNCFDMKYGSIACIMKELIKLYLYYIRAVHVHKVRDEATNKALEGLLNTEKRSSEDAIKAARERGNTAARRASMQLKHVMGPLLSGLWDLFETIYVGGSFDEGMVRCSGTFLGAYFGGLIGDGKLGWLGFILGSQFGTWFGSRVGLLVFDVSNGLRHLFHLHN